MSYSTIAISMNQAIANSPSLVPDTNTNPSVRKRAIAVTEEKLSIELGSDGGISRGKDMNHSTRTENVLEKPNDLLRPRKVLVDSTISPRRRKVVPKPEKSIWKSILSIFMKNLVLLLVITGLAKAIWKWARKSDDRVTAPVATSDIERQISEVESFLRTTAKMMQVQVEVVDRKIENEVLILKGELEKKVEEICALFEKGLKRLGDRTDKLDKYLDEHKDMGFLSKKEFENFVNGLKSKGLEGVREDLSLDKIRVAAREIVEKEIVKHAADGLGRVDYALASGGARVVRHSEPFSHDNGRSWLSVAKSQNVVHFLAQKMLEPSFGEPGHCFPLKGSSGFVEIRLRTAIIPEAVTLEHVAKSIAYDRSTAPKDCRISAWYEGPEDVPSSATDRMSMLVEFTYDLEKSNAQTFDVEFAGSGVVNMVRLDFTSNHGGTLLTCIYRLRVHGYEPLSVPLQRIYL